MSPPRTSKSSLVPKRNLWVTIPLDILHSLTTASNDQGTLKTNLHSENNLLEKSNSGSETVHLYSSTNKETNEDTVLKPQQGQPCTESEFPVSVTFGFFSMESEAGEFKDDSDNFCEIIKTDEFEDLSQVENSKELYMPPINLESHSKEPNTSSKGDRLAVGNIPKQVKCYSCEVIVMEDCFSDHLLFGPVRCSECRSCFEDCHTFKNVAVRNLGYLKKCNHTLKYISDPFAYIKKKLSYVDAGDCFRNIEFSDLLENYITSINSLENKPPWQYAIKDCKDYIALVKHQNIGEVNDICNDSKRNIDETNRLISSCTFTESEEIQHFDENDSLVVLSEVENNCSINQKTAKGKSNKARNSSSKNPVKNKQIYSSRKKKHKRTLRKLRIVKPDLPANGFYHITRKHINECPNCNCILYPMKVSCSDCNLVIFIGNKYTAIRTDDID